MKKLEEKILKEGQVVSDSILKVGSFLNQQLDTKFLFEMGEEIYRLFKDSNITKIFTIEASGIAIALAAAYHFDVPVVFAKKNKSLNVTDDILSVPVKSFTHNKTYDVIVSREYITKDDTLLIIDDFLAAGNALKGLFELAEKAGAKVAGAAIAIEKGFQGGGDSLREKGIRVESLAIVDKMENGKVYFRR